MNIPSVFEKRSFIRALYGFILKPDNLKTLIYNSVLLPSSLFQEIPYGFAQFLWFLFLHIVTALFY